MSSELKIRKLFEKANNLLSSGQHQEASQQCRKLLKLKPNHYSGLHLYGVIQHQLNDIAGASLSLNKALKFAPDQQEKLVVAERLAQLNMQQGQLEAALKHYVSIGKGSPERMDVQYQIAQIRCHQSDFHEGLALFRTLLNKVGPKVEVVLGAARCLKETGQVAEAIGLLIPLSGADNIPIDLALVECLNKSSEFPRAEQVMEALSHRFPQDQDIRYKRAIFYRGMGKLTEAAGLLEKVLEAHPDAATVYYNYSRLKTFTSDDPYIEKMKACYERLSRAQSQGMVDVLFALGKVHEDIQEYDRAFQYWQQGNDLKRKSVGYSTAQDKRRYQSISAQFSSEWIEAMSLAHTHVQPIFVVSMPRAGSTLVEQILSAHDQIQGVGESMALPQLVSRLEKQTGLPFPECLANINRADLEALRVDYLRRLSLKPDVTSFVDKLPGNFWLIGLIKVMFPHAKIIHSERNELDTCFSCYKHLFGQAQGFSYDMESIQFQYQLFQQTMAFWRTCFNDIYQVSYEELVAEPNQVINGLLKYCDVSWQDQCINFHQAKRVVTTASAAQVRQPLNRKGVGMWEHYRKNIQQYSQWLNPSNRQQSSGEE